MADPYPRPRWRVVQVKIGAAEEYLNSVGDIWEVRACTYFMDGYLVYTLRYMGQL